MKNKRLISIFSVSVSYIIPILVSIASIVLLNSSDFFSKKNCFVLSDMSTISGLGITSEIYTHQKHKTEYLKINSRDRNNYFALIVKNPDLDGSGMVNIMKHFVEQGSDEYPVINIFRIMNKKSYGTVFEPNMTNSYTVFSFQTSNFAEFYKNIDVFLHSVFKPRINQDLFNLVCYNTSIIERQNGTVTFSYDGISIRDTLKQEIDPLLYHYSIIKKKLFSDSSNKHSIYGNIAKTTSLNVDTVKDWHTDAYHPSNVLFFHYGSFDSLSVMTKISSFINVYTSTKKSVKNHQIDKWLDARSYKVPGPQFDSCNYSISSISWALGDLSNISDVFDAEVLSRLILEGKDSPLLSLLKNLYPDYQLCQSGLFTDTRIPRFTICIKSNSANITELNNSVRHILRTIVSSGFEAFRISKVFHRIEMEQKIMVSNQGQKILQRVINGWVLGKDPLDLIEIVWEIERIKRVLTVQPKYFEMLLFKKLVENMHRVDLYQFSDPFWSRNNIFTLNETNFVENEYPKNIKDDPLTLPSVHFSELDSTTQELQYSYNNSIYFFHQSTGGLVHIQIKAEIPVDCEYIEDLPFLMSVLTKVGAGNYDSQEFLSATKLITGGISCWFDVSQSYENDIPKAYIIFEGSSLNRNSISLVDLMELAITQPHFHDKNLIEHCLNASIDRFFENFQNPMNSYGAMFAGGGMTKIGALKEMVLGISSFRRMSKIIRGGDWSDIIRRIENVFTFVLNMANFTASINCEHSERFKVENRIAQMIQKLNIQSHYHKSFDIISLYMTEFQTWPKVIIKSENNVKQSVVSIGGPSYNDIKSIDYEIGCRIITDYFDRIRSNMLVHCKYYQDTSVLSFHVYNDSSPYDSFNRIDKLVLDDDKLFSLENIEMAIIKIFSQLDTPIPPYFLSNSFFIYGITPEEIAIRRKLIHNCINRNITGVFKSFLFSYRHFVAIGHPSNMKNLDGFQVFDFP